MDQPGLEASAPAERGIPQFLSFQVGSESCALDLGMVREIIRVPPIVGVPLSPPMVAGIANLRGHVLPVVSARRALGVPTEMEGDGARVVVLHGSRDYGLLVDGVAGVIDGEPEPLQVSQEKEGRDYVAGTFKAGDRAVLVVDPERLVRQEWAASTDSRPDFGSASPEIQAEEEEGFRYLAFQVSSQDFGLPVGWIREISRLPKEISQIPHAASYLLGIAPLRGHLLPLVDLRQFLGLPGGFPGEQQRVLVLASPSGNALGLVVDRVKEVLHSSQGPEPLPALWKHTEAAELDGMLCLDEGKRLVAVLDGEQLLQSVLSQLEDKGGGMKEETDHDAEVNDEDSETLVVFLLSGQEFGIPVGAVKEILRLPEQISRVPGAADFVEGMVNLRGQVLPVLDQRRQLGLTTSGENQRQRILVLEAGGDTAGFVVDAVRDVLTVPRSALGPAPTLSQAQARVVHQVVNLSTAERMILVLDPEELLKGAPVPPAEETAQ